MSENIKKRKIQKGGDALKKNYKKAVVRFGCSSWGSMGRGRPPVSNRN